ARAAQPILRCPRSLFFYNSDDHPVDLHSFPTRRSSDLYLAREVSKKLIAGEFIETKTVPVVTEKIHAAMLEEFTLEDRINDEVRSEEHTSELQSLTNLVCRLLLEKKK